MIKKICIVTLSALSIATVAAHATTSTEGQIQHLQTEIKQLQLNHNSASIGGGLVSTNPALSKLMLGQQHGVNTELSLLKTKQNGQLAHGLIIGGLIEADAIYQHTNKAGVPQAGGYLHSNPTFGGITAKGASRINLTSVDLQFVSNINPWATGYIDFNHILDGTSNTKNLFRNAYILIGDLNSSPFYGLIGRNDINFGQFASVNPYTMPLNRQFFQANGNVAEIGFDADGFNAAVSAMNGGLNGSTVDSTSATLSQNLATVGGSAANISNFAINTGYNTIMGKTAKFHLGAGFLRGTSNRYLANGGTTNGAWDINTHITIKHLDLLGEFTSTLKKPEGTNQRFMAWQASADYHFRLLTHETTASLSYSSSNTLTSSSASRSSKETQYVVGLRSHITRNVSAGIEYAYLKGDLYNGTSGRDPNLINNTVTLDITSTF